MPTTPPNGAEAVLKTGNLDPAFVEALQQTPIFDTSDVTILELKDIVKATLPNTQKRLATSKSATVVETTHHITVRDGWLSRTIRIYPARPSPHSVWPLIVLFYGGGHCIGEPEFEVSLARQLSEAHNAVVFLPSYRLAPEHPFPYSINDSWDVVQALAAASLTQDHNLIPASCDPARAGFIVGGTSAGANLTAAIAHLSRDLPLHPPLTGQFLCCGTFIAPTNVPPKYRHLYLSWEQNVNAPIMPASLYKKMRAAFKPDFESSLWASFDQHDPRDKTGKEVSNGHLGVPPAYFQACGADMSRDDSLIYEKVLREECDIPTRLDLYSGWSHCWWTSLPAAEMSKKREQDTLDGIGWLLHVGKQ